MYFKRLEIQGFKSFAEPTKVEFLDGLTCVVGPNGSGKSNISDAVRWVLGEQSAKSIRGGKMEEIIFAGTKTRRPKSMAEVTLIIDNEDRILPIEYSEVAIRRRLFRSGESEYAINGNSCRLKDIRNLFVDTGIGVDGYSIIGQGKIADIISEKEDNLKEIFEEAAGIVKYKIEKREAERKLETVRINLSRTTDILAELETRVVTLKEESEKAKEYQELSAKHKELEVNIILKNFDAITGKLEDSKKELVTLEAELEELSGKKEKVKSEIEGLRKRKEELLASSEELKESQRDLEIRIIKLEKEKEVNEEKKRVLQNEKSRIAEEIEARKENLEEEKKQREERKKNKEEAEKKYEELKSELAEKEALQKNKNAEVEKLNEKIEAGRNHVFELSSEKVAKESSLESIKTLLENFDAELEKTGEENEEKVEGYNLRISKLEETIKSKLGEEKKIEEERADAFSRRDDYVRREADLHEEKEKVAKLKAEAFSRKNALEEIERSGDNLSLGVKEVLDAKLKGVFGTVADLIKVPAGYEIAIETALGPAAQNLICESDEAAKAAIAYLKENRLGRATFLPLGSLRWGRGGESDLFSGERGFDDIASDIVTFDKAYEEAFLYLLDKVVIMDDIDNALAISKKGIRGYRFVTMDGDVIAPGGSMTGGRYKSKKNAGLLGKRAEIKKLEITYNELAARESEIDGSFDSIRSAKQKLEESIVSFDAKIRELATLRANLEGELKITRERLSEYAGAEEQKEQSQENLRKDRERYGEQVQVLRREIEDLTAKISEVEAEVESDIEKLGVEKDGAGGSEVTELSVRLAELGKEKEYAGIDLETIEGIINAGVGDIAAREERLAEIAGEEKRFEEETSIENAKQDADKNRLATDEKLTEINAEREKLKLAEEEKEKELEASESELEKSKEIKIALDMEINRQENRMESLNEKLFAEFTMSYEEACKLRKDDFVMSRAEKENREAKNRLAEIGPVNIFSIKEYAEVSERYDFMTKQKEDILESIDSYEKIVTRMERAIKSNFAESFDVITANFKESFSELFGGGSGEVRLIDSDNPLEAGLELVCQPPGKKLQNMNLLSGGEKTMTAIALMFAVLKAKPSPFCILDEIEAALDEKNIVRFCEYLLKFSGVQFTLITHQKATMEYANALYGISMPEKGVSKLISLRLEGEGN